MVLLEGTTRFLQVVDQGTKAVGVVENGGLRLEGEFVDGVEDGHPIGGTGLYKVSLQCHPRLTCGGGLSSDGQFGVLHIMKDLGQCDSLSVVPSSEMSWGHARVEEWIRSNSGEVRFRMVPDL